MRYSVVLMLVLCLFAVMAMAGPKQIFDERSKKAKKYCLRGRKKNGRCRKAKLRVRSVDTDDFFEIPDVEEIAWDDAGVDEE